MRKLILLFIPLLVLVACQSSNVDEIASEITEESIMDHISVLASDEFEGRGTGTRGEDKAVEYLVKQLKEIGATSGVADGSFIQPFPLLGQKTVSSSMGITRLSRNTQVSQFKYFDDFVAWPANQAEKVDIKNAELVYVGYGIQAPEENWDDFKDVDVKGKIIIIKNNDPEYDENVFAGKTRLYYGRYTYKYEKAKEMGALGAIIIHTTPTAGYGWNVVSNGWSSENFYVKSDAGADKGSTEMNGWLTYGASKKLFERAGLDLDDLLESADSPDFEPVVLKNTGLSVKLEAKYRNINAKNVVAKIEGSDDDLKDEYLLLSAHFDHLGITTPVDGDSINNGAEDNAAGVSVLLNMLKGYKKMQPDIKRSVLATIVSAEEVGLLGSEYWANNPTVPLGKVAGNINLDGTNVYGETKDVVIIGYGRSTLADLVVEEATKVGRPVKPDAHPEQGLFYRSDHFNMAKVGIPAIFPNPGTNYIGKTADEMRTIDSVSAANYHSVNDEVNEYWDLSGAVKDTRLFFKVGLRVLNADDIQAWHAGDEFEAARLKSLNK
ncbi:MAG: M28 family peptidase [Balneolaceae bacterium]